MEIKEINDGISNQENEMMDDDIKTGKHEENALSSKVMFQQFNDETTIHGMRFVFGSARSYKKRFVWAPVIFTCLILFLTEVSKRVSYFMDYPSTINIISTYSDEIIFPAVTICNQNDFRRTLALKNGHYNVLAHLFSEQFLSSMPLSESEMNISLRDLYANNAHDKKDMIVRCLFKGQPCTPENFTSTLTNYGQCYTFNGDKNNPHTIDSPGLSNALHLLINTEEYDNMEGSHVGGGIKVLLHRQDEFPLPNEYGHSLPTGRQGFLDVTLSMENLLPAPYGYCKDIPGQFLGNYSYSKEACKVACQNTFIMKKCGCRLFFMPSSNDSMQVCKVRDSQCISQAKAEFHKKGKSRCNCLKPCTKTKYVPSLSFGSISDFSSTQLMKINSTNLKRQYVTSREVAYRFEEEFDNLRDTYINLTNRHLKQFYDILEIFENMNNNTQMCMIEVNKFDEFILSKLIAKLRGSHPIFRIYPLLVKYIEGGPFGVSEFQIEEFIYSLETRLMAVRTLKGLNERKIHFPRILKILDDHMQFGTSLSLVEDIVKDLLNSYPNIWFKNLDLLENGNLLKGEEYYEKEIDIKSSTLPTIISKSLEELQRYRNIVKNFEDTGEFEYSQINQSSNSLIQLVFDYAKEIKKIKLWWKDDLSENLFHLAEALEVLRNAQKLLINDLNKNCDIVHYAENIRRTCDALNLSTEKLKQYLYSKTISMAQLSDHFLTRDMHYFVERLRTFVTNAVGELRKDRSPSECLLELLTSYDNSVQWYQIIGQLFDTQPPGYCYTIRKQLMDSMNRFHINASVWYDVLSDINKIVDISQRYKDSTEINKMFYRNNFLGLKILFHDLDYDVLTQQQAYDVYALLGDLGGAMGLFIGASIISMFEIADFIVKIFHIVFKRKKAIKDANM